MVYYVIVLSKPTILNGELVEVIGPFNTIVEAQQWFDANLSTRGIVGVVHSVYKP